MKLNEEFILREIAGTWAVLPLGNASIAFNGMLTLNEAGALLWHALEQGKDPVDALTAEYDVSREQAAADVQEFLEKLRSAGCLTEE